MRRFYRAIPWTCIALSLMSTTSFAQSGLDNLFPDQVGTQPASADPTTGAAPASSEADRAFQEAMRALRPMSPGQIEQFKKAVVQSQRAVEAPIVEAKPVSRPVQMSLKPGEKPPVIRLSPGHVSTLTFSGSSGDAWPVQTVTIGNPEAYSAQSAGPAGESNIVVLSPLGAYAPSNLVVTLVGHPVPIIMTLRTGDPETDYRVDVQVEARGPNASFDVVGSSLPPTGDSSMLAFLDGVPPNGAEKLETGEKAVEAWSYDDLLYVRTRSDLLSPAYISRSANVSGVKVFVLVESPVLILSEDGRMRTVSVGR